MTDTPESNPVLLAERRLAEILAARGIDGPAAILRSAGRTAPDRQNASDEDVSRFEKVAGSGGPSVRRAKEACLRLLTVRARSRAEIAGRLTEKGFTEPVVTTVLDQLTEVGLVDDAAFAEEWVRSRHTHSGKGRAVLAEELRRKGIANDTVAAALATIDADDERQRAADLVRRKLRATSASRDPDRDFRRLVAMLARRGYPQSLALSVVRGELSDVEARDEQR